MIRYDAAAGHVVLVEWHHSVLSMFRAVQLYVVELWLLFFVKETFLKPWYTVDIAMDWLVQHPTDQYAHAPKSAGNTLICACVFFCPIYECFLRITLPISLFRTRYLMSGFIWQALLSLPHYRVCLRSNREKKKTFRMKFLEVSFPGVPLRRTGWCAFIQSTSIIRSTQAATRFLRSVCILMLLFQAFRSRPERTHTSYLLIIYLWCIFTFSIISVSFDISHDIGIEISQTYSRCWYRYISKISHDISRILDTIPNTTSKQFRTIRKFSPQLVAQLILLLYLLLY